MKLSINDWHIVHTDVQPVYPALMWCWNDGDSMAEVHTVVSCTLTYMVDDRSQPYKARYQHAIPLTDMLYELPVGACRMDDAVPLGRTLFAYDNTDSVMYLRQIGYKNGALFVERATDQAGYNHVVEPEEPHIEYATMPDDDCAKTPSSDATIAQLQNVDYKDTNTLADDRCCEESIVKQPDIAKVLVQRGTVHGDFTASSGLATSLQSGLRQSPNWQRMSLHQQRALNMICEKITRICYGDPNFADHWIDIAGYATLGKDGCHE